MATTSASTPGRDSGVAGGGGESSQQATSSLLGPLASPAAVVPGQGLLGGGVGQGGEGSSQVNVFWSPEARKLVGSNQATPVGTAERRSREAEAVEAIRQRLAREMEEAFQREVQQLAASASAVATVGDPNGGGGSAEGEVQSSAGGLHGGLLGGQQLPLQSIGVPGTMVAYPPGLPADGRGGSGGGESASESLRTLPKGWVGILFIGFRGLVGDVKSCHEGLGNIGGDMVGLCSSFRSGDLWKMADCNSVGKVEVATNAGPSTADTLSKVGESWSHYATGCDARGAQEGNCGFEKTGGR